MRPLQPETFNETYVKLVREFMGWARRRLNIPLSSLRLGLCMQPALVAGFFGFIVARGSSAQTIKVKCSNFKRVFNYLASSATGGQLAEENLEAFVEWAERLSSQAGRAVGDSGAKAERMALLPQMDEWVLWVQSLLERLMARVQEELERWGGPSWGWGAHAGGAGVTERGYAPGTRAERPRARAPHASRHAILQCALDSPTPCAPIAPRRNDGQLLDEGLARDIQQILILMLGESRRGPARQAARWRLGTWVGHAGRGREALPRAWAWRLGERGRGAGARGEGP